MQKQEEIVFGNSPFCVVVMVLLSFTALSSMVVVSMPFIEVGRLFYHAYAARDPRRGLDPDGLSHHLDLGRLLELQAFELARREPLWSRLR